ncbi:hypothetical protein SBA3_3950003 [Candidatus Sulfopaludibacter sp. SbA3]|nr:hypothetical protein SBA3_3950003 [Candidatus Sulfopaludibacter sp. SbA3]
MSFSIAEKDQAGHLPMTSFDQHDIGKSIAVEVADAGVGGSFRNCLQRNNFKRTQAAGLGRFTLRPPLLRREKVRMGNDEPGRGARNQD